MNLDGYQLFLKSLLFLKHQFCHLQMQPNSGHSPPHNLSLYQLKTKSIVLYLDIFFYIFLKYFRKLYIEKIKN